jgi:hypothetical protein
MHATNDRRALSLSLSLSLSLRLHRLDKQCRVPAFRTDPGPVRLQVHLDKLDWEGASKWDNTGDLKSAMGPYRRPE